MDNRGGGSTTWYGAVFLVVNAALGAGLLNFPSTYHQAGGIYVAIMVQLVLMIFIVSSILILVYCSDIEGSNNYQEVVYSMCGNSGLLLCSLAITLYCFGTCITFMVIIGDQWQEFFIFINAKLYCTVYPWYMNRMFIISITSIVIILPLCFPKKIDFLKYASIIGVSAIVYIVVMVIAKYFAPHAPPGPIATKPKYWTDVFYVIPMICFSYQCHVSVIPIYSCMFRRTLKEFSKTIFMAILLCVVTYTIMATFGYLTFGAFINSDILLSYQPDTFVIIAVFLLIIKTYTTYPILHFCGRAGLDSMWCYFWNMSEQDSQVNETKRRVTMTILWFLATLVLTLFIPNIGVMISLLGSLAAVFIFIFPGLCILQIGINWTEPTWKRCVAIATGIIYLVIGSFIFGVTISQSIIKDIEGIPKELPGGCKDYTSSITKILL